MWIRLLIIGGFGFIGICLLWRESHWRSEAHARMRQRQSLHAQTKRLEQELAKNERALNDCRTSLDNKQAQLTESAARIDNQETQIAVLKKRWERSRDKVKEREQTLVDRKQEIRSLRTKLLNANEIATPDTEDELNACRDKVRRLTHQLDEAAKQITHLPSLATVQGISSDGRLLALSPADEIKPPSRDSPMSIGRRNQIIATGKFHQFREGLWICRIDRWNIPFSALVIGENLFMLPTTDDGKNI